MMKAYHILRIVRIIAMLELLGGIACFLGALAIQSNFSVKLIHDGLLTPASLERLRIYIWISTAISVLLAYGLLHFKNWARNTLIIFAVFGLVNVKSLFSPTIFTAFIPFLPAGLKTSLEMTKAFLFISMDFFLIYFFTRKDVRQLFSKSTA